MPASLGANTARHVLVVLALGGALAACDTSPGPALPSPTRPTAATTSPEPAELAALRARPLRSPTFAAGDECPITQPAPLDPPPPAGHALSTGEAASALGHAPLFPDARFYGDRSQLRVRAGALHPGWYGAKAPWASRTGYRGWALIRTVRLNGPGHARVQLQLGRGGNQGQRRPPCQRASRLAVLAGRHRSDQRGLLRLPGRRHRLHRSDRVSRRAGVLTRQPAYPARSRRQQHQVDPRRGLGHRFP